MVALALAWPMLRKNLLPICRMPANTCSTLALRLAMALLRRSWQALLGQLGWALRWNRL